MPSVKQYSQQKDKKKAAKKEEGKRKRSRAKSWDRMDAMSGRVPQKIKQAQCNEEIFLK